ncbi:hypothetical protein ACXU4B_02505 [Dyella soli]|uniref:Uncharacterized protein n=1 Tax=Dyella soli TaxID=522319 RepID=A0A4R0YSW7_9GAMM|nr:hypothetical protein [Dyella soli]TCI09933.1 hypothetical protein EZM97_13380 [Dyella soli]
MSEYLLARYRPIANALLAKHQLEVDESTRDTLAMSIMHNRVLSTDEAAPNQSPVPAAKKALGHARALLKYAAKPPRRKDSIPKRRAKLLAILLDSDLLAFVLGIQETTDMSTDGYRSLLDSLEIESIDTPILAKIAQKLEAITVAPNDWQSVGRPWGLTKKLVRCGCMAWWRAGNPQLGHGWDESNQALTGALPDFLRDLLTCCNGTSPLIAQSGLPAPKGYAFKPTLPRGNGLRLSDASLKMAIIECSRDDALRTHATNSGRA